MWKLVRNNAGCDPPHPALFSVPYLIAVCHQNHERVTPILRHGTF